MSSKDGLPQRVAFVGTYFPRQCGIGAYTFDLCRAMMTESPDLQCLVLPINDVAEGYEYPPEVRFEISEQDLASYRRAADFLNFNNVDLVCLQHEYGIFGGPAGSHILALLQELRMPVVTTLHTVLREPDDHQRQVLETLAEISDRLVVMSERGCEFLQEIYRVPEAKIDRIPHGIPDVAFVDPNFYKDQFGVEGRSVLLTFGLLSANKGIEYVIQALPTILEARPEVVYIILGATHPQVRRREGEAYRLRLEQLARELGVDGHVLFHNRFVSLEELLEFIGAADIYVTPYLSQAQIVSGTLSYALGAGKAVISTPYWYAEEMLVDGRGVLVPFADSEAIAQAVVDLLENEAKRHAMRKRAYLFTRDMVWPQVARQYLKAFRRARRQRLEQPRPPFSARTLDRSFGELPLLKLDHLRRMTDDTGLLQHAVFSVPNYAEGYTTDDNARALVLTVLLEELGEGDGREVHDLATRYTAFLWNAYDHTSGRFRNFLGYDRRWLDDGTDSEDAHARALWGLATLLGRSVRDGLRGPASHLFEQALPPARAFTSPRAWAFTLLAIHEYLRRFAGDRMANDVRETLAERLYDLYRRVSQPDWPWFEEVLTYANAKLSHAMLLCGQWMRRPEMVEAGLRSLEWLAAIQRGESGQFVPIGNRGFYPRGGERARFDQQPIEAYSMVSACLEAHRMTGEERWYREAQRAFDWFLGRNDLRLPLYDPTTGGCRDGLQPDGVNQNQGAESTLSFLLALAEMHLAQHVIHRT